MHREIENIRYCGEKIAFDFRGHTIMIREPTDLLLVDGGEAAQRWIANGYGFLLAFLSQGNGGMIDAEAKIDDGIDAEADRSRA
jgi:hypothetical protein